MSEYMDIFDEQYRIYKDGSLYSNITEGFMSDHISEGATYLTNTMYNPRRTESRHRLVANAFITNPRPDIFTDVDHIDRDPSNNKVENLRFCTARCNILNCRSTSTKARRGKVPRFPAYIKLMGNRFTLGIYPTEDDANAIKDYVRHLVLTALLEWHTRPLTTLPPRKWKISAYGIERGVCSR
jgi:hypothetical protein